jgi:predicted GNAT family N-acyltransferase
VIFGEYSTPNMPGTTASLDPPEEKLDNYDATLARDKQVGTFPVIFIEAMAIREEVFVREQGVPLENEYDDDDPRSAHFVTYADVSDSAPDDTLGAIRKPVGCIRVVPPPHAPHEHNHDEISATATASEAAALQQAPPPSTTSTNKPNDEPYLKIGRLAVLEECRGKGYAGELIRSAEQWAVKHAVSKFETEWTGWVLIHAQVCLLCASIILLWLTVSRSKSK